MAQERVFSSSLEHKLVLMLIIAGIITFPVLWVFTHPWSSESPVAITLAVLLPLLSFPYNFRMQRIVVRDGTIVPMIFIGLPLYPPLEIKKLTKLEFTRSPRRGSHLIIHEGERFVNVDVGFLSLEKVAIIVCLIRKQNPEVELSEELKRLTITCDDEAKIISHAQEYDKLETKKWIPIFVAIIVFIALVVLWRIINGEPVNLKQLVDLFA